MIGMIRKTFIFLNLRLLRILYATFIRPLLEFGAPAWSPSLKGYIDSLEKIQPRVTRLIPALKRISYEERMYQMGITSLEVRRRRGDLIQIFKIFNEFEKVNSIESLKFLHSNRLQEHSMR